MIISIATRTTSLICLNEDSFSWDLTKACLLFNVAVNDFGGEPVLLERLSHRLRQHDRAVLSACAAERNGQITFPFADVMRDQIGQQAFDAAQEFPGLWKRADIFLYFRCFPGERTHPRHH